MTGEKVADWYWNGFFIYFLVWKLSYILFNFRMFSDMPFSIVYFNGGTKGHILALVILSIYLLIFAPKKYPSIYQECAQIFLLYFICYEVIRGFLEKNTFETFIHLTLLVGFVVLFLLSLKKTKNPLSNQLLIVFILLELLIKSSFGTALSMDALPFIWIGLIVYILRKREEMEDRLLE